MFYFLTYSNILWFIFTLFIYILKKVFLNLKCIRNQRRASLACYAHPSLSSIFVHIVWVFSEWKTLWEFIDVCWRMGAASRSEFIRSVLAQPQEELLCFQRPDVCHQVRKNPIDGEEKRCIYVERIGSLLRERLTVVDVLTKTVWGSYQISGCSKTVRGSAGERWPQGSGDGGQPKTVSENWTERVWRRP